MPKKLKPSEMKHIEPISFFTCKLCKSIVQGAAGKVTCPCERDLKVKTVKGIPT